MPVPVPSNPRLRRRIKDANSEIGIICGAGKRIAKAAQGNVRVTG